MGNTGASENVNGGVEASLPLLQELACAADSGNTKDRLSMLFRREIVEDSFSEAKGVSSIEIMRRMQLDDMKKASRLLLMARETQLKMHEKSMFVAKLRRPPGLSSCLSIAALVDVVGYHVNDGCCKLFRWFVASARKKKGDFASLTTPPTPTPTTTVVAAPRLSTAAKGKKPARATTPTEPTAVERTEAEQLKI
nr:hypothetical protein [Tanacetum cinerariifolium]